MSETGDTRPEAQNSAAAEVQAKLNQGIALHQHEDWQTRSAAMGRFCSANQTILMRCIYSELLLVKHGGHSGELN